MKKQITLNRTASLIFATSLIAVTLLVQHFVLAHGDELEPDAEAPTTTAQSLAGVATVGSPETEALGLEQLAWSGEIVSQDDTNVVPAREGQIASWTVAIGDKVHKGQVLGKLVVSPANPELASLLAESKAAIIKAEAQRRQSLLASDSGRARLLKLQGLIDSAGQSAIIGIDKEVEKTYIVSSGLEKEIMATTKSKEASLVNVASELAQAETKEKLLQQQARADADRLMRQLAVAMGIYGLDSSSAYVRTEALPSIFGVADSKGRNQYLEKLGSLFEALKNNTVDIAEKPATEYVKAAHRLLSATITNEELDADKLAALQALLSEDESRFLASVQAYKLAVKDTEVKRTDKDKISNDFAAQLAVLQARLDAARADIAARDSQKNKQLADNSLEIGKQKNELDNKIADFDREVALTKAEVSAAQAAYQAVATIGTGEQIIALSDGVISAIHKNVGDHVSPETVIADIASGTAPRIIRFRLAYDSDLPQAGDLLKVELFGFPFERQEAIITGVGSALDDQGFLTAEAKFKEMTNWPTHAQVKISALKNASAQVFIPLTAIWLDEEGRPTLWLVMENNIIRPQTVRLGRRMGNQVEVSEGLSKGQRYLTTAAANLKTGQLISQ